MSTPHSRPRWWRPGGAPGDGFKGELLDPAVGVFVVGDVMPCEQPGFAVGVQPCRGGVFVGVVAGDQVAGRPGPVAVGVAAGGVDDDLAADLRLGALAGVSGVGDRGVDDPRPGPCPCQRRPYLRPAPGADVSPTGQRTKSQSVSTIVPSGSNRARRPWKQTRPSLSV